MFSDDSCESWIVISRLVTDWSLFGPSVRWNTRKHFHPCLGAINLCWEM